MDISPVTARKDHEFAPTSSHPKDIVVSNGHDKPEQTYISLNEFGQINVPNFERNRVVEQLNTPFVHLEAFFEILIVLQEGGVVDDDLGIGYP